MATASKTMKGFQVSCPFCGTGEEDGGITLDVNDLHKLTCRSCDEEFTAAQAVAKAAEQLRRWQALAEWIEAAGSFLADAK